MDFIFRWNIDPEITTVFGLPIRYYSLCFAAAFILGYQVVKRTFRLEGIGHEHVDKLLWYIFIGTLIGARLGHCLFYEPQYYLNHPLEMILPFTWYDGKIEFTGFQGLASHGGILGVFIAIWLYCRKSKLQFLSILDKVAIGGALAGAFIRLGNFMNSEIIGMPTNGSYGIIFERVDGVPRHPAQLYEAIAYLLIFCILIFVFRRKSESVKQGYIFGLFFALLFIVRFLIEFIKIDQVAFEQGMLINMGQILSIPFALGGIIVMWLKRK